MTIPYNLKTTNFELTADISAQIEEKLGQLERLLPEDETAVICDIELAKTTDHHQSGRIYRAEINLEISGKLFRTEATEEKMQDAIDRAKSELKRELRKSYDKRLSLIKRGGRRLKEMLRFGF